VADLNNKISQFERNSVDDRTQICQLQDKLSDTKDKGAADLLSFTKEKESPNAQISNLKEDQDNALGVYIEEKTVLDMKYNKLEESYRELEKKVNYLQEELRDKQDHSSKQKEEITRLDTDRITEAEQREKLESTIVFLEDKVARKEKEVKDNEKEHSLEMERLKTSCDSILSVHIKDKEAAERENSNLRDEGRSCLKVLCLKVV